MNLQPVRQRPRGLIERAKAAREQDTRDGLLLLNPTKRTPPRLLRWLLGE